MDLQDVRPKSQAELLFEAQIRKDRQFRANVALSWIILLAVLVLIFSGKESLPFGIKGIQLDTGFIAENWSFIASGIWSTIGIAPFHRPGHAAGPVCRLGALVDISTVLCSKHFLRIPYSWNSPLSADLLLLPRLASIGHHTSGPLGWCPRARDLTMAPI